VIRNGHDVELVVVVNFDDDAPLDN
jgi:hypothetical protein